MLMLLKTAGFIRKSREDSNPRLTQSSFLRRTCMDENDSLKISGPFRVKE